MLTKQKAKFICLMIEMIIDRRLTDSELRKLNDLMVIGVDLYYDTFCDAVFKLSEEKQGDLVIDESGYTYITKSGKEEETNVLVLLSDRKITEQCDDIILYIDMALDNLAAAVHNGNA